MPTFRCSIYPVSPKPWRNAATRCAKAFGEPLLRNPITGITGCCARAASGHAAAAPPRSRMNSRRLMGTFVRLRAAHYHAVAEERRCASQQKLRANVADGSRAAVRATLALSPLCPPKRKSEALFVTSENGMDRPRSRPQRHSEDCRGLSAEGAPHASRIHGSRSDRHWNRYGQEHTSHGRSRFVWRHRTAREGLARTHRIEARESATLPHWYRSRDGDTLCCS